MQLFGPPRVTSGGFAETTAQHKFGGLYITNAVVSGLLGSAVTSNLVNNLPSILVFISGAQAGGVPEFLRAPFLFGALAGADLGPNLTPVGALSTMLWLVIVRRRGLEVSAWDFFRIGALVAPLTLLAAGALIAMSFR